MKESTPNNHSLNDSSSSNVINKKVFIGSACFKLEDVRAELATSIKKLGYIPIWNESPDFPKKKGVHSHDLCLDAVKDCDIYLLIIDKRYGGTYAGTKYPKKDISITWYETMIAFQENKEVYCYVREQVWNERPTYKKNLAKSITPHHVDNPKVFEFIDYINEPPSGSERGNWIDTFKNSVDLKEKLAFRLKRTLEELFNKLSEYYRERLQEEL